MTARTAATLFKAVRTLDLLFAALIVVAFS